jgi:hypothetical protein
MKTTKKLIEIKQGDKSAFILTFNNAECGCPHKQPVPKQNSVSQQVSIEMQPCMSNCPLFNMEELGDEVTGKKVLVTIGCGGMPLEHTMDEVIYSTKLESKTLIV